ncbi:MAG: hypothetical protein R3E66_00010 [bacterium]
MKAIKSILGITLACAAMTGCNSHPVSLSTATGSVEYQQKTSIDGSQKVDILWVVDNSGSMCQEQKVLRDNFTKFIDELNQTNLDFHIGVTTTHMISVYAPEPVASPGRLQSTPQPIPGFDQSCINGVNAQGQIIEGDFGPIRAAIAQAVECMATPDPSAYNWSDAEIDCAANERPNCSIPGVCDAGSCVKGSLFPPPSSYRNIPKVLRSADYKNGNVLDVARLTSDFACASLVGTRGYGVEAGLAAAVEAVSPINTGGAADGDPTMIDTSAPNHGLIRRDANFALIFVSDENDCSNNALLTIDELKDPTRGIIDVQQACSVDQCEFENVEGKEATSLLLPVERLKEQLIANLSATKGRDDVGEAEILVASIHGNSKRFKAADVPAACDANSNQAYVTPSCASLNGVAYSGDRYERFLRTFPVGNYYPEPVPTAPDTALTGWLCNGDFGPALEAIGQFINRDSGGCVSRDIMPCEGPMDTSCPAFPYTGAPGQCVQMFNTGIMGPSGQFIEPQYYCNSGIQLRAKVTGFGVDPAQKLTDSGYCIDGSIGDRSFPDGCVIAEDRFDWVACPSGFPGLRLQWNNDIEALNALNGTELQIRYNSATSEPAQ